MGPARALLFLAGVALALVSPLDRAGEEYLLSAHILQHVLIGDAAPALLVLAVRGPLCVFMLPRAVLRPVARLRWLRGLLSFLEDRKAVPDPIRQLADGGECPRARR